MKGFNDSLSLLALQPSRRWNNVFQKRKKHKMGNTWTFFISHYNVWLRSQKRIHSRRWEKEELKTASDQKRIENVLKIKWLCGEFHPLFFVLMLRLWGGSQVASCIGEHFDDLHTVKSFIASPPARYIICEAPLTLKIYKMWCDDST